MLRKVSYVSAIVLVVAFLGVVTLKKHWPVGPVILCLALIPLVALVLARRSFTAALPDLLFGAVDTGLLTVPALWGGVLFGVAGAIAGGIIGDSLTDAIAGFFEGTTAEWFQKRGIQSAREPVTTSLGKMGGCLLGAGLVLTAAYLAGIALPTA